MEVTGFLLFREWYSVSRPAFLFAGYFAVEIFGKVDQAAPCQIAEDVRPVKGRAQQNTEKGDTPQPQAVHQVKRLTYLHRHSEQGDPGGEPGKTGGPEDAEKGVHHRHHQHVPQIGTDEAVMDAQGDKHLHRQQPGKEQGVFVPGAHGVK